MSAAGALRRVTTLCLLAPLAIVANTRAAVPEAPGALRHAHDLSPAIRRHWQHPGLPGPAPAYTNILDVRRFGARGDGITDDSAAIQALISQAPDRSVVLLPAGTYRLLQPLYLKSHIILRGEGAALTRLHFEGAGTAGRCIGILRWDSQQTATASAITAGMTAGATNLVVVGADRFRAGDIVELDEDNDPAWNLVEPWQARLPGQIVRVAAVDATKNQLLLERPLRHTFTAARQPRIRALNTIVNAGIEALYLRRQDAVDGHTIELKYAVNCWVHRVHSEKTYKHHVTMERSYACEVRQSYFHDSHAFSGGQGYGVACSRHTSNCLVEDNGFRLLRHSMSVGLGAGGNVYAYNFSTRRALDPARGTPQADISIHGNYASLNLFEGNVAEAADVPDWYWPAGPNNTLLRNLLVAAKTAILVGSDDQNLLGNRLPMGVITPTQGLQRLRAYGNVQSNASAVWPECGCKRLPTSCYRDTAPAAFTPADRFAWPPIGPDVAPREDPVIPAQQRDQDRQWVP